MNEAQANEYIVRINKACDHIDRHLTEEMTLSELARVAGFSEYHFHRIFAAMTGETLFATHPGRQAPRPGDSVRLRIDADDLLVLPQDRM